MIDWLVDVGNSNTRFARWNGVTWKQPIQVKTSEIKCFLEKFDGGENLVVSSVVPDVDDVLKTYGTCFFIHYDNLPILKLNMSSPEDVGADRLMNALAGYTQCSGPCIVVDSGTAITFCYVDENAVYQGGAIFPGMGISSLALAEYTAKIPYIEVQPMTDWLGKNTKEAVQIGLYHGFKAMLKGMITSYKARYPEAKIIGTGSGLKPLKYEIGLDSIDDDLIFHGLAVVAKQLTG